MIATIRKQIIPITIKTITQITPHIILNHLPICTPLHLGSEVGIELDDEENCFRRWKSDTAICTLVALFTSLHTEYLSILQALFET